jgi:hypothetical protein
VWITVDHSGDLYNLAEKTREAVHVIILFNL